MLTVNERKPKKAICGHQTQFFNLVLMAHAARAKTGPAEIGAALINSEGEVLLSFSSMMGVKESNEAEILAIHQCLKFQRSWVNRRG